MSLIPLFLALCLVLSSADRRPKPTKRTFVVETKGDNLRVVALYKNGTYEDSLHFNVRLQKDQNLVQFQFSYDTKTTENRTSLDLTFNFQNIIEFEALPSSPAYNGSNLVVQTWPDKGTKLDWGKGWTGGETVKFDVDVWSFSATCDIFTVTVNMAASDVQVDGLVIDPNSIKIDFAINNFPYSPKTVALTRLALITQIQSHTVSKNKGENAVSDHKLIFDDATSPELPLGAFSWIPSAVAGSSDVPIVASFPEQSHGQAFTMYFTFLTDEDSPHPSSIIWDPTLGLDYSDEQPGFCIATLCGIAAIATLSGACAGLLLIIVIIVVVIYLRRRDDGYEPVRLNPIM
jgi:hypothetical protein